MALLADAGAAYGLPWIALRYFNAAGADPDGYIGEDHNPETDLIPLILRAARDKSAVEIYGIDYSTPDGIVCAITSM
jgi:UDP-glucose 4-epimerase